MYGFKHKKSFSLIELLVVLFVISILASLLLPALSRSKSRARQIVCFNNQKQLSIIWALYYNDNNDKLVGNGDIFSFGNPEKDKDWVGGYFFVEQTSTNLNMTINPDFSLFGFYNQNSKIFICPKDETERIRSYALNCYIGDSRHLDSRITGNYFVFRKLFG